MLTIRILSLACLLSLLGCREFYDQDFDVNNAVQDQIQDRGYVAVLNPTDPSSSSLAGDAQIEVKEGRVQVNVNLNGIPQNIIQLHYGFINSDCDLLNIIIPNSSETTRDFVISETFSTTALELDLQSSGAATSSRDINLEGKSLVVKAFSNFSGIPNPTGTNLLTIACGKLSVSDEIVGHFNFEIKNKPRMTMGLIKPQTPSMRLCNTFRNAKTQACAFTRLFRGKEWIHDFIS